MKRKKRLVISVLLLSLLLATQFVAVAAFTDGWFILPLFDVSTPRASDDPYVAPLGAVPEESSGVRVLSSRPTTLAQSGLVFDSTTITINSAPDLVVLSMLDPQIYQDMDILFASSFVSATDVAKSFVAVTSAQDSGRYFFRGLGDAAHPYRGNLLIYEGGTALSLVLNRALFHTASNEMTLAVPLTIYLTPTRPDDCYTEGNDRIAMQWQEGYAFAEHIVFTDDESDLNLTLSVTGGGASDQCKVIAGLIGDILPANSVSASACTNCTITVSLTLAGVEQVTSSSDTGLIAGRLQAGTLYLSSLTAPSALPITSTGGNAGGIVGSITADAGLRLHASVQNALSSPVIQGTQSVGGVAGLVTTNGHGELPSFGLSNVTLKAGNSQSCGGLYGHIRTVASDTSVTIALSDGPTVTLATNAEAFGGLVGVFTSADIRHTLTVNGQPAAVITTGYKATNFGGYIGRVLGESYVLAGGTADDAPSLRCTTGCSNVGGIVGSLADACVLDVHRVTVTSDGTLQASNGCGGLAGTIGNGSVVRLTGAVDLSGVSQNTGSAYGVFVGKQANSLVYADGATLTLPTTEIDEIGNYGGLIRQGDGALNGVVVWDADAHTATVATASLPITTTADFARLAIYIQSKGAFGGAPAGSDIALSGNAVSGTITLGAHIDMTGTGLWGLLRDNGEQNFSGSIDGKSHTLTLSPTRTIYRHSHVGLLSKVSGATVVRDLTVAGTTNSGPKPTASSSEAWRRVRKPP